MPISAKADALKMSSGSWPARTVIATRCKTGERRELAALFADTKQLAE